MTDFYEELYKQIENGTTLVMPSEDAARNFLTAYVINKKKSVLKSSCISMQEYLNSLYPSRRWLQKADDSFRILFAAELVKTHKEDLLYFIPENSTEDFMNRSIPFIASILPSLDEAESLNGPFKKCTDSIKKEYTSFMQKSGRYEENWREKNISIPEKKHALVYPALSPREERTIRELKLNAEICSTAISAPQIKLEVYDSQKTEVRNTMLQIVNDMLEHNLNPNEIAITATDLDVLRPYLEKDARLFGINLAFKNGTPLSNTPAGKYINYSRQLHDSKYDTSVIRNFTMDSAIPLQDRSKFQEFTKEKLSKAVSNIEPEAMESDSNTGTFLSQIKKLNAETDPEKMLSMFDGISRKIFKARDEWSDKANASYREMRNKAERFSSTASELREKGLIGELDLYPLFVEITESAMLPSCKEEGIAVYAYPESAGMHFKKHYILNLSEDNSRTIGKKAEFLSDYEIKEKREEIDKTDDIIRTFALSSDATIFSCSTMTYSGAALPLIGIEKAKPTLLQDPWRHLHISENTDKSPYPAMVTGFANASGTSLLKKNTEKTIPEGALMPMPHEVPFEMEIKDQDGNVTGRKAPYSYSLIDSWRDCPYLCYLKKAFRIDRNENYEINENYATYTGTVIHKALEKFFESFPAIDKADNEDSIIVTERTQYGIIMNDRDKIRTKLQEILEEEFTNWENGLGYNINGELKALPPDTPPLTGKLKDSIIAEYLESMTDVAIMVLSSSDGWLAEVKLSGIIKRDPFDNDEAGYAFEGSADLITRGVVKVKEKGKKKEKEKAQVRIIDYKTGNQVTGKSQFWIYRELLDNEKFKAANDITNDENYIDVAYSYLKKGKLNSKPKDWDKSETRKEMINTILDAAESIRQGDWHARTGTNCKNCVYKGICRMNFGFENEEMGDGDNE